MGYILKRRTSQFVKGANKTSHLRPGDVFIKIIGIISRMFSAYQQIFQKPVAISISVAPIILHDPFQWIQINPGLEHENVYSNIWIVHIRSY